MKSLNLAGCRFGRLLAISSKRRRVNGTSKVFWLCQCDCGKRIFVGATHLPSGNSKSCGCKRTDSLKGNRWRFIHGAAANGKISSLYRTWSSMKSRCFNPKNKAFPDYGGRGITVCKRWVASFVHFAKDIGERPTAQHSLDRKDNDGNYTPSNCVWATKKEQIKNRRPHFSHRQVDPMIECSKDYYRRCRCTHENSVPGSLPRCLICQNAEKILKGLNQ